MRSRGLHGARLLTLEEYDRVRADATHFVVVPGHEQSDIERIVEENERFTAVEKPFDPGRLRA